MLRRGVGGPLNPKSAIRGADNPPEASRVGKRLFGGVMKVGSHATRTREPGQAREGAAISGLSRAPWGSPAGALKKSTPRSGKVEGGRTAPFAFSMIEVIIDILIISILALLAITVYSDCLLFMKQIMIKTDKLIDELMAVGFLRGEMISRTVYPYEIHVTENSLSYKAVTETATKTITYSIKLENKTFVLKRSADGEGSNYLYESRRPMKFTQEGSLIALHVEGHVFYIFSLTSSPNVFSNFPGAFPNPQVSQAQ